jgi:phage protein D
MNRDVSAPRAEVRISGRTLAADASRHITSVSYDNNDDLADMFTVTLANPAHRLTDSPLLTLGKTVEIHMGYGRELRPMMLGEIAAVQPSFPEGGVPTVTVTGYDRSYPLRHNDPSRGLWTNTNDSLIAAEIAGLAGLIPVVDPSPYIHEELPQTASDMAFLKERARENFFVCYVRWDRLYFRYPRPQTQAHVLTWGRNLGSFAPRLSSSGAEGVRVVRGYNAELAEAVVGLATAADIDTANLVERLGSEFFDGLIALGRQLITARGRQREEPAAPDQPETPAAALGIATALLREVLEGLYEGSGTCVGIPEMSAGDMILTQGLGRRYSGRFRLKRVTHVIDDSGYRTSFEVAQRSGESLLALLRRTLTEAPPPNRQHRTYGLRVGKVDKNVDEAGLGRVKVVFPGVGDDAGSTWARVATPMAGADRGLYLLPDEKDDVVVAFLEGSQRDPVVLGSVWNMKAQPPVANRLPGNNVRVLKTHKHEILLDDTDTKEQIVIRHAKGATVTLRADGSVAIEAKGNLELTATGDVKLSGANVLVQVGKGGVMDVTATP